LYWHWIGIANILAKFLPVLAVKSPHRLDYPVAMAMSSQQELLAAFATCAAQITLYYRALGDTRRTCQRSNGLWFLEDPGLVIDYVPEVAREGIDRMAKAAHIKMLKSDGGQGKQAYYIFLAEGLTPQKLETLTDLVQAEISKLHGSP
jgi:hypothetical protein